MYQSHCNHCLILAHPKRQLHIHWGGKKPTNLSHQCLRIGNGLRRGGPSSESRKDSPACRAGWGRETGEETKLDPGDSQTPVIATLP